MASSRSLRNTRSSRVFHAGMAGSGLGCSQPDGEHSAALGALEAGALLRRHNTITGPERSGDRLPRT
jgi:hypothetical protein